MMLVTERQLSITNSEGMAGVTGKLFFEQEVSLGTVGDVYVTALDVRSSEDRAVEALGLESFAADWESDADAIYDDFLKDAGLQ